MHIVFVHTPMATVALPERAGFWRNFDICYHAAHPGLRHMRNLLWELPHWMMWLGGVLVDAGYDSLQALDLYSSCNSVNTSGGLDGGVVRAALRRAFADVYLFSPMTPNLHLSLEIADAIKELYPKSVTVFGGVIATPMHRHVASHKSVDYVVFDRGEYVLPLLLRALEGKVEIGNVCNLSFKDPHGDVVSTTRRRVWMPVNEIPFPKVDLFRTEVGKDIRYLRQVYALGCPYKCSFCTIQTIGQPAEYFRVDRVLSEISAYKAHYGHNHNIYFGDETFTLSPKRTRVLCAALREVGSITYDCQTRPNLLNDQTMVDQLRESGCRWIEIGIEAISQKTLDRYKRGIKLLALEEALARVRDAGIAACAFMVNGFPDQTVDDMKRSIDLTCSLIDRNLLHASYLFGLVPYPGSDIYENPPKFGAELLHNDFRYYHEDMLPVYRTPLATPDEVFRAFLEGITNLTQAMGRRPEVNAVPLHRRESYGKFWSEAHV